ncbi:PRMT16 [Symbiodinium sp. CCMP2456]|nr:PRMT16 [Symbiodinium sp. CCMP2456]
MLHDTGRNEAYANALRALSAPPELVLDLGAGTGLLAGLACQEFPSTRAVACEVYAACADVARQVLEENGLHQRVRVVNKVASDLEVGVDLPQRADVCVFELFDSQLLGESILPILRDAQARLLQPSCTFVPRRVTVRAMLVTCPAVAACDLPELRGAPWPLALGQLGLSLTGNDKDAAVRGLSEPWDAFAIDFGSLPSSCPRSAPATVRASHAGVAHAVAWWWELDMGGGYTHSSWTDACSSEEHFSARHHWRPCLSFLAPTALASGDDVRVVAAHDDEGVWFAWHSQDDSVPSRWVPGITAIPPERDRLLIAAQESYRHFLSAAMAQAASEGSGKVLFLPSEDYWCMAALGDAMTSMTGACKAVQVSVPIRSKALAKLQSRGQWPHGLQAVNPGEVPAKEGLAALEPFVAAEARPWCMAAALRRRGTLNLPVPASIHILAVLVECQGVWMARQPLGSLCGLSMKAANPFLVPARNRPLECNLCEMAWRPLSSPRRVLELDLSSNGAKDASAVETLEVATPGRCHGIAFWAEFAVEAAVLSTGPSASRAPTGWSQALHLFEEPVGLMEGMMLELHLAVEGEEARIHVRPDMTCIRAACRALQDENASVRALAIPMIRTLIAGQDPKCCVAAAKVAALAMEHADPDVQHAGSLALVGISKVQNGPPVEKKKNINAKMTLQQQMEMLRSSQLATLQPRRQYNDAGDDADEETFPKVSNEELDVVIAMLDRAELRANGQDSDDSKDQVAASIVLDTLNAMAERSRAANGNAQPAAEEEAFEEVEEWEDTSGSEGTDTSFSSGSGDEDRARAAPKKRLQEAVKKAFIGKLAAKNTKTLKAMGGEGGGPSIAEKMRKVHQKEGQMQSWRKVEALLSSGDLQKRQAGLKEVSAAAGISASASAKEGVASVTQRKAQAKRLLRTMATSDPCWQVREATLDLFVEVASEVNVDFIPAALEAMGDAMWQVRRAALRACSALCASGEAVLTPEDMAEAVEAAQGLVPDWNSFVSLEALGTLERFSDLGYRPTSGLEQAFARALHHRDKEVREKAGATLYRSANTSGHEEAAAQAIAELLAYVDLDVKLGKDEACLLLKRLGPTSISVGAVSSRISQGYDEPTRCAALTALAEFAKAGEEHPPGTAVEGDEREKEKESTNEIRKVQERSQWAMKAAQATARLGLQDPAAVVRQEAIGVMGGFGLEAWQQALQTVQGMLESLGFKLVPLFFRHRSSLEPSCRCSVLEAVANLFATSDAIQSPQGGPAETLGKDDLSAILELIASCFEDPDADVRNVATSVLCGLAMGGKGGGLELIDVVLQLLFRLS